MIFRKTLQLITNTLRYRLLPANIYARNIGVKMGQSCQISSKNFGTEPYLIELGDNVHVTSGVTFVNHEGGLWVFRHRIPDFDVFGKIKVGSNTYIGNNATILYGVEIGKNCIVGYGSVVTKSVPPNSVVAGCPARVISDVKELELKMREYNMRTKLMSPREKKDKLLDMPDNSFFKK